MGGADGQAQDAGDAQQAREERFDEICADYLDAADAGDPLDEEKLLVQHPDLAESLRKFFRDHQRMAGALHVDPGDLAGSESHDETTVFSKPSAHQQSAAPVLGQRIADYELIEKIAQGGMGVVYKARQVSLNRIVALKMIRSGELADEEEINRFRVEAEAAAQLHHPGIVPIYQIGSEGGQHYFSMAFVEGQSLAGAIREQPMPPRLAAKYVMEVARATHYAHEQGIIHRDIKPANVLLDKNGKPMVTDFGLAKQIQADHQLTMSGQILGTASFMSPEQARGDQRQIGPQSDVYSLGALLYTLLTQRPPFTGDNPLDILLDVLSKDPDAPSSSNLGVSRDVETICLKCLEKKPGKRYATAADLADDLDRFLTGRPIVARPVRVWERCFRWCRRKPAFASAIVLAVVGLPLAHMSGFSRIVGDYVDQQFSTPKMVIDAAKTHYAESLSAMADTYSGQDRLYVLAAMAMLQVEVADREAKAKPYFRRTLQELEVAAEQSPDDDGVKFAITDCLAQLTLPNYSDLAERRQLASQAIDVLRGIQSRHPDNRMLEERIAWFQTRSVSNLEDLEAMMQSAKRGTLSSPKLGHFTGVIRFDFHDAPMEKIDSAQIRRMHERLLEQGEKHARKVYVKEALSGAADEEDVAGLSRQLFFSDLALLLEGQDSELLLESVWLTGPKGIYDTILGIRLSTTDFADRRFQTTQDLIPAASQTNDGR